MGWSNIWTDYCDTEGSWACHLLLPSDGELCQQAYIQRSVPISAYAGRPLRLSFYVHLESGELPNDRCRMRFAYDNEDYDIDNYDWQCGDMKSTR
eukprot:823570_1